MAGVTAGYSSFTLGPGEDYGIFLTLTITESSGRVIGALSRRIAKKKIQVFVVWSPTGHTAHRPFPHL